MNQCLIPGSSNPTTAPSSASGSNGHHTSLSYTHSYTVMGFSPHPRLCSTQEGTQVLWVSSKIPSLTAMAAIGWADDGWDDFVSKYS